MLIAAVAAAADDCESGLSVGGVFYSPVSRRWGHRRGLGGQCDLIAQLHTDTCLLTKTSVL